MRAVIRTLSIRFYTVTLVTGVNGCWVSNRRRGTSTLGISGPLRVSTTHGKHERNL